MELTLIIILSAALAASLAALVAAIIKKNALAATLKTKEEYDARLEEKHERAIAELQERREKEVAEQKELREKAVAEQKELREKELAEQKELREKAVAEQKELREKELAEQKELREKDLQSMKDTFKALSAENSSEFRRQSAESISELLKPVQEKFAELGKAVQESRTESAAQSAQLKEHIHDVMERSQAVAGEARNLADALTGYSKVQGDFGEMLLTDVLKNAGLTEGVHFFTQGVMTDKDGHEIKNEDGGTMIPDVMVFYPDDTTVIIDSKVSLKDYMKYLKANSVEDRVRAAKAHVESVRKHVDELKSKDYASYLPAGKRKVDYNLMFIPVEGAFRLMLDEDPMLWQVAKDNKVLIVSQMTLIIVLNMIQMAWKQADQEKNITEVYEAASELMGQLSGWMNSYVKIGESLENARAAYKESTNKLTGNNQCVIKKIQKLENLRLAPKKSQAKIKTGTRKAGPESIIPAKLSQNLPEE